MNIDDMELPECLARLGDGSIRVAGHRVSLFRVLDAIYDGHSITKIHSLYPTISKRKLEAVRDFRNTLTSYEPITRNRSQQQNGSGLRQRTMARRERN